MIFIGYRQSDSEEITKKIYERLNQDDAFHNQVFRDKDSLEAADNWPENLTEEIDRCRLFIVVMGPTWKTASYKDPNREGHLRLHNPMDRVRLEIEQALQSNKKILVVTIDNTKPPSREWFRQTGSLYLERLCDVQITKECRIRCQPDTDTDNDLETLVKLIRHILKFPATNLIPPLASEAPKSLTPSFTSSEFIRQLHARFSEANLRSNLPRIMLSGPVGMGKSEIALSVLWLPSVESHFGHKVHMVKLGRNRDQFLTNLRIGREQMVGRIADSLGIPPGHGFNEDKLYQALKHGGLRLLVLDDIHDLLSNSEAKPVRDFFSHLASIPNLALIATTQQQHCPHIPGWEAEQPVPPLTLAEAHLLFTNIAGKRFDVPLIDEILKVQDGYPLGIVSLAAMAQGLTVKEFCDSGVARQISISRTSVDGELAQYLEEIVRFGFANPKLDEVARSLLSLLALLPEGLLIGDDGDLGKIFGREIGIRAARDARLYSGLVRDHVDSRGSERLKMPGPIRTIVREKYSAARSVDLDKLMGAYFGWAKQQRRRIGKSDGAEAVKAMKLDSENLLSMIEIGLKLSDPAEACDAAVNFSQFAWYMGHDFRELLDFAAQAANHAGLKIKEADCIYRAGKLALVRGERDDAFKRYSLALKTYEKLSNEKGMANCLKGLGDVESQRENYTQALNYIEQARVLYVTFGDVRGESNCLKDRGKIQIEIRQYPEAKASLDLALEKYRRGGEFLGELNAKKALAELARRQAQFAEAKQLYTDLIPLYTQAGDNLGVANCRSHIGECLLELPGYEEARKEFETARDLYVQVGDAKKSGEMEIQLQKLEAMKPK